MATTRWMTCITTVLVRFLIIEILASNNWYEIKKVKGIRPQPRYRHSAVVIDN